MWLTKLAKPWRTIKKVVHYVNRETQEASNLTDPSLNVNNVLQVYQILKVLTCSKYLMINQGITEALSAKNIKVVNLTFEESIGISGEVTDVLLQSWEEGTNQYYSNKINIWTLFYDQ